MRASEKAVSLFRDLRKNKVPVKQPALKQFNPIDWDVIKPQVPYLAKVAK